MISPNDYEGWHKKVSDEFYEKQFSNNAAENLLKFIGDLASESEKCQKLSNQELAEEAISAIWMFIHHDTRADATFTELLNRIGHKDVDLED